MKTAIARKNIEPLSESDKWLASQVVDGAISVHRCLGPGLDGSIYKACFEAEMKTRKITVSGPHQVPVIYQGQVMDASLPVDLIVEDAILIALQPGEQAFEIGEHYLLSCLKFSGKRLAYLLNFNHPLMKDGIRRLIL
jgi:GxxExxY protein